MASTLPGLEEFLKPRPLTESLLGTPAARPDSFGANSIVGAGNAAQVQPQNLLGGNSLFGPSQQTQQPAFSQNAAPSALARRQMGSTMDQLRQQVLKEALSDKAQSDAQKAQNEYIRQLQRQQAARQREEARALAKARQDNLGAQGNKAGVNPDYSFKTTQLANNLINSDAWKSIASSMERKDLLEKELSNLAPVLNQQSADPNAVSNELENARRIIETDIRRYENEMNSGGNAVLDIGLSAASSAVSTVAGLFNVLPGVNWLANKSGVTDAIVDASNWLGRQQSDQMHLDFANLNYLNRKSEEANPNRTWKQQTEDYFNNIGEADAWWSMGKQIGGSFIPGMVMGGPAGRVVAGAGRLMAGERAVAGATQAVSKTGNLVGKAAEKSASRAAAGTTETVAAAAQGTTANTANRTLVQKAGNWLIKNDGKNAGTVAGTIETTLMGAGDAGTGAYNDVMAMDNDELKANVIKNYGPAQWQEIYDEYDGDMDRIKRDYASNAFARSAYRFVPMAVAAGPFGVEGMFARASMGRAARLGTHKTETSLNKTGFGKRLLSTAAATASEAAEEGYTQVAGNLGEQPYTGVAWDDDVAPNALLGALGGFGAGGTFNTIGGFMDRSSQNKEQRQKAQERTLRDKDALASMMGINVPEGMTNSNALKEAVLGEFSKFRERVAGITIDPKTGLSSTGDDAVTLSDAQVMAQVQLAFNSLIDNPDIWKGLNSAEEYSDIINHLMATMDIKNDNGESVPGITINDFAQYSSTPVEDFMRDNTLAQAQEQINQLPEDERADHSHWLNIMRMRRGEDVEKVPEQEQDKYKAMADIMDHLAEQDQNVHTRERMQQYINYITSDEFTRKYDSVLSYMDRIEMDHFAMVELDAGTRRVEDAEQAQINQRDGFGSTAERRFSAFKQGQFPEDLSHGRRTEAGEAQQGGQDQNQENGGQSQSEGSGTGSGEQQGTQPEASPVAPDDGEGQAPDSSQGGRTDTARQGNDASSQGDNSTENRSGTQSTSTGDATESGDGQSQSPTAPESPGRTPAEARTSGEARTGGQPAGRTSSTSAQNAGGGGTSGEGQTNGNTDNSGQEAASSQPAEVDRPFVGSLTIDEARAAFDALPSDQKKAVRDFANKTSNLTPSEFLREALMMPYSQFSSTYNISALNPGSKFNDLEGALRTAADFVLAPMRIYEEVDKATRKRSANPLLIDLIVDYLGLGSKDINSLSFMAARIFGRKNPSEEDVEGRKRMVATLIADLAALDEKLVRNKLDVMTLGATSKRPTAINVDRVLDTLQRLREQRRLDMTGMKRRADNIEPSYDLTNVAILFSQLTPEQRDRIIKEAGKHNLHTFREVTTYLRALVTAGQRDRDIARYLKDSKAGVPNGLEDIVLDVQMKLQQDDFARERQGWDWLRNSPASDIRAAVRRSIDRLLQDENSLLSRSAKEMFEMPDGRLPTDAVEVILTDLIEQMGVLGEENVHALVPEVMVPYKDWIKGASRKEVSNPFAEAKQAESLAKTKAKSTSYLAYEVLEVASDIARNYANNPEFNDNVQADREAAAQQAQQQQEAIDNYETGKQPAGGSETAVQGALDLQPQSDNPSQETTNETETKSESTNGTDNSGPPDSTENQNGENPVRNDADADDTGSSVYGEDEQGTGQPEGESRNEAAQRGKYRPPQDYTQDEDVVNRLDLEQRQRLEDVQNFLMQEGEDLGLSERAAARAYNRVMRALLDGNLQEMADSNRASNYRTLANSLIDRFPEWNVFSGGEQTTVVNGRVQKARNIPTYSPADKARFDEVSRTIDSRATELESNEQDVLDTAMTVRLAMSAGALEQLAGMNNNAGTIAQELLDNVEDIQNIQQAAVDLEEGRTNYSEQGTLAFNQIQEETQEETQEESAPVEEEATEETTEGEQTPTENEDTTQGEESQEQAQQETATDEDTTAEEAVEVPEGNPHYAENLTTSERAKFQEVADDEFDGDPEDIYSAIANGNTAYFSAIGVESGAPAEDVAAQLVSFDLADSVDEALDLINRLTTESQPSSEPAVNTISAEDTDRLISQTWQQMPQEAQIITNYADGFRRARQEIIDDADPEVDASYKDDMQRELDNFPSDGQALLKEAVTEGDGTLADRAKYIRQDAPAEVKSAIRRVFDAMRRRIGALLLAIGIGTAGINAANIDNNTAFAQTPPTQEQIDTQPHYMPTDERFANANNEPTVVSADEINNAASTIEDPKQVPAQTSQPMVEEGTSPDGQVAAVEPTIINGVTYTSMVVDQKSYTDADMSSSPVYNTLPENRRISHNGFNIYSIVAALAAGGVGVGVYRMRRRNNNRPTDPTPEQRQQERQEERQEEKDERIRSAERSARRRRSNGRRRSDNERQRDEAIKKRDEINAKEAITDKDQKEINRLESQIDQFDKAIAQEEANRQNSRRKGKSESQIKRMEDIDARQKRLDELVDMDSWTQDERREVRRLRNELSGLRAQQRVDRGERPGDRKAIADRQARIQTLREQMDEISRAEGPVGRPPLLSAEDAKALAKAQARINRLQDEINQSSRRLNDGTQGMSDQQVQNGSPVNPKDGAGSRQQNAQDTVNENHNEQVQPNGNVNAPTDAAAAAQKTPYMDRESRAALYRYFMNYSPLGEASRDNNTVFNVTENINNIVYAMEDAYSDSTYADINNPVFRENGRKWYGARVTDKGRSGVMSKVFNMFAGATTVLDNWLIANGAPRIGVEADSTLLSALLARISASREGAFTQVDSEALKGIERETEDLAIELRTDAGSLRTDAGNVIKAIHVMEEGAPVMFASMQKDIDQARAEARKIQAGRQKIKNTDSQQYNRLLKMDQELLDYANEVEADLKKMRDMYEGKEAWDGKTPLPGGMTRARAKEIIREARNKYGRNYDRVEKTAYDIAKTFRKMRNYGTVRGAFTQADTDNFNKAGFDNYVSLYRPVKKRSERQTLEDNVETSKLDRLYGDLKPNIVRSLGLTKNLNIYRRRGSTEEAADAYTNLRLFAINLSSRIGQVPFEQALQQTYEGTIGRPYVGTVVTDEEELAQLNTVNGSHMPGIVRFAPGTEQYAERGIKEKIDGIQPITAMGYDRHGVLKRYNYYFTDAAIQNEVYSNYTLNDPTSLMLMKNLASVTRFASRMTTTFKPLWNLWNWTRDSIERLSTMLMRPVYNSDGKKLGRYATTKAYLRNLARLSASHAAQQEIYQYMTLGKTDTPLQKILDEAIGRGAITLMTSQTVKNKVLGDIKQSDIEKYVTKAVNKLGSWANKTGTGRIKQGTSDLLDFYVIRLSELPQITTGLAAYMAYRDLNVNREEAANRVRDQFDPLRANNAVLGNLSPLFPFLRSTVAGHYNVARTLSQYWGPGEKLWTAGFLLGSTLGMFAIYFALGAMYGDDDDGVPILARTPTGILGQGPTFRWGETGSWTFNVGFGIPSMSAGIAANLYKLTYGTQGTGDAALGMLGVMMDNVSPTQLSSGKAFAEDPFAAMSLSFTPFLFKSVMEEAVNRRSFGGGKIYNQETPADERDFEQGSNATSQSSKKMAKWLYETLGVDVRPETIQHTIETYSLGPLSAFSRVLMNDSVDNTFGNRPSKAQYFGFLGVAAGADVGFQTNSLDSINFAYDMQDFSFYLSRKTGIARTHSPEDYDNFNIPKGPNQAARLTEAKLLAQGESREIATYQFNSMVVDAKRKRIIADLNKIIAQANEMRENGEEPSIDLKNAGQAKWQEYEALMSEYVKHNMGAFRALQLREGY